MNIRPLGDYYVWYCEWCDTKNLTLWTRFEKDQVFCGACHNGFQMTPHAHLASEKIVNGML